MTQAVCRTFLQIDPESPSSFPIGHQTGEGGTFLQEWTFTAAPGRLGKNKHHMMSLVKGGKKTGAGLYTRPTTCCR